MQYRHLKASLHSDSFVGSPRRQAVSYFLKSLAVSGWLACFALVTFASAAGLPGSDTKPPGTRAEPSPIIDTEPVPDQALENRILSLIRHVEDFKKVHVSVSDGVVRLSGEVARVDAKEKIERLVSRVRGVLYVDNHIKSATDVETRVGPVLGQLREYAIRFTAQLPLIVLALGVLLLFSFMGRIISRIAPRYAWFGINPMIKSLISRLITFIFVVAGIIIALDILDVTVLVGTVVGTAGIAGLAIGFAFKDIVENYLAGLLLSIRALFSINDHVLVAEHEGRVVRLTAREMVVMTLDGNHVLIPNSTVFKSVIVNFTRNHLRRTDFAVGIGTSEDLVTVRRIGVETLKALKGVLPDPGPFMRIEELGDFTVKVRFFAWIDQRTADFFKVRSEAIRLVKEAFDEAGIEMPFPTQVQYDFVRPEPHEGPIPESEAVAQIEAEAATADVSVDTQLDRQIEEDLSTSQENNYLRKDIP